jgi:hypothetical protein
MKPVWLSVFIDLPAADHARGLAFWRGVTGYEVAPDQGDNNEYATLIPPEGDPHLRVQRLEEGPARVHLDLHHPDQDFRVRGSPAGLPYCEVYAVRERRARPVTWPGGHRSVVDQICIDIPPSRFDEECAFWSDRTGWPLVDLPTAPEFSALDRPREQLLRILLQRLDDEQPHATAHLDVSTDDRGAETRRHRELGATVVREHAWWTVLRDPVGSAYCVVGARSRFVAAALRPSS